jgi:hypothetical protein
MKFLALVLGTLMINEALGCDACGVPGKVHDMDETRHDDGGCNKPIDRSKPVDHCQKGGSHDAGKGQKGDWAGKGGCGGDKKDGKPHSKGDKSWGLRKDSGQGCARKPIVKPA